jgi:hypothetical protein
MDVPTFIVGLLNAIAWPAAVVLIVLLLRAPISARLAELTRLKWKDLELEFQRELKKVEEQADKLLPKVHEVETSDTLKIGVGEEVAISEGFSIDVDKDQFSRLAELSPPAAIIQVWLTVENALRSLAARHDIPVSTRTSSLDLIKLLTQREILDNPTIAILNNLRALRNNAAHARASELSASQAKEYQAVTHRLVTALMKKT